MCKVYLSTVYFTKMVTNLNVEIKTLVLERNKSVGVLPLVSCESRRVRFLGLQ